MLSYMTLLKMDNIPFYSHNYLSLSGATAGIAAKEEADVPIALWSYLKRNDHIKKIILHLDNDDTGKRATQSIISILDETYKCVDEHPTYFKDINEKLVFAKMDQQRKEKC